MQRLHHIAITVCMLLGLPLAGIGLAGRHIGDYLEFPPRTQRIEHAPFSWPVFIGLAMLILATLLPLLIRIVRANLAETQPDEKASHAAQPFPWWGWTALGFGLVFWFMAWTRFPWFSPFQIHTFTPLWLCYIVVVNAQTLRRTGRCLLTHEPAFLAKLFLLSAIFWWFFEYLNRFVQNWWYTAGSDFTPLQYFVSSTLPFATVLPAVLSTEAWLASHPGTTAGLAFDISLKPHQPKPIAWAILILSGTGLFLIGLFPDVLFPLLWVAPLLLLVALRIVRGSPPFFPEVCSGDFRRIFRFALAALICGFFWEMWNWHSSAKWIYAIPYVGRFQLFEMPILGYAGYLPFGLECAVFAQLLAHRNG